MTIKRKGIVAVPGEYLYGDVVEIKTAEELKAASEINPIVPLTIGHPLDVVPRAADIIGTVSQKWDEKNQRVNGEFWFHDEKIPEVIKDKLMNNQPVPISAGYLIDNVDVDGTQHGIVYTHIAVLEGENPKCPLDKCGVNLRTESLPNRNIRYEKSTEITAPEPKVAQEEEVPLKPDVVEVEPESLIPKSEEPAEENPEEEDEEPEDEEVKLVPETIIPVGRATVPNEWEVDERGYYVFYPHKKTEK